MLDMIENSMYKYIDVATETINGEPINGSINEPISGSINEPINLILTLMKRNPQITYGEMAAAIGKSRSTVLRLVQKLKAQGKIIRVGSNKDGHWEVTIKD
jgi:predicted HTH transcriptional regulator